MTGGRAAAWEASGWHARGASCLRAGGGSVDVCLAFEAFGKFARDCGEDICLWAGEIEEFVDVVGVCVVYCSFLIPNAKVV